MELKGVVKFYNEQKGFGFITSESGKDIFVHSSGLVDHVREGSTVEFEQIESEKGPKAINVKVVAGND